MNPKLRVKSIDFYRETKDQQIQSFDNFIHKLRFFKQKDLKCFGVIKKITTCLKRTGEKTFNSKN